MTTTYSSQLLSSVGAKRPTVFHCNIQWPLLYFFHRNKKFKSLKVKTFKVRFTCSHFCGKQFLSLPTKTRAVNFQQFTESALASRLPGDMSSKSMKCQETACDEPQRACSECAVSWLYTDCCFTDLICTHAEDTSASLFWRQRGRVLMR